jgi:hypothetical protein
VKSDKRNQKHKKLELLTFLGDRILSVNGTAFNKLTFEDALRILRASQDNVVIITESKSEHTGDIFYDLEVELLKKQGWNNYS